MAWPAGINSGMQGFLRPGSGGVARASLNHRLIAVNPPGSATASPTEVLKGPCSASPGRQSLRCFAAGLLLGYPSGALERKRGKGGVAVFPG